MTKAVAWQVRNKDTGWGPPATSKKIIDQLAKEGYQVRPLGVIEEVHGLSREERLERCALKYLDYLGVSNPKEGLEQDLLDKEMLE